ncbi:MAG: hypothetical protein FJ318_04780 [SAR202 cluster bacterium]|nr:hypothetical protein [SAR202 cluster bacterium]
MSMTRAEYTAVGEAHGFECETCWAVYQPDIEPEPCRERGHDLIRVDASCMVSPHQASPD